MLNSRLVFINPGLTFSGKIWTLFKLLMCCIWYKYGIFFSWWYIENTGKAFVQRMLRCHVWFFRDLEGKAGFASQISHDLLVRPMVKPTLLGVLLVEHVLFLKDFRAIQWQSSRLALHPCLGCPGLAGHLRLHRATGDLHRATHIGLIVSLQWIHGYKGI